MRRLEPCGPSASRGLVLRDARKSALLKDEEINRL